MLKFKKLNFEDVKTDAFGEEITIRVNAESVKYYTRKVNLLKKIVKMKLSDEDETAYNVAANLMSICTDPKNGEFSFHKDQLTEFVDGVGIELFTDLSNANLKVNPSQFVEVQKTITAKKKST